MLQFAMFGFIMAGLMWALGDWLKAYAPQFVGAGSFQKFMAVVIVGITLYTLFRAGG